MKKLILILLLIAGCSGVTTYQFKDSAQFSKSALQNAPDVGIAILNDEIKGLNDVIKSDLLKFADRQLDFSDISQKIILKPDLLSIENISELKEMFPKIKYIIIAWQDKPKIKKNIYITTETTRGLGPNAKDTYEINYEEFRTTVEIRCEVMLFDLPRHHLIARAEKVFAESSSNTYQDRKHSNFLAQLIQYVLREKREYPVLDTVSASRAKLYFYFFLKHINYEGDYDSEYIGNIFSQSRQQK